ncbi:MAG: hypothetical protein JWM57_290 [Phycisphaerales bacterium]|nr:hypothetical protein [Phycisphaerales bacterium]
MRAYGGMVLSVCYKVTKDAADAEDASQAVFLTLAVQCKTGNPIQYLGPWLKKVAKRTALDLVRSKKRRTRRETVTAENRPEHYTIRPGAKPEADELNAILRAELDELPGKYKMPLVLHYFGGLSHDQISKEMKCTTAALGVRLHRARKMLGKRLTARGISLEGVALTAALAAAIPAVFSDRFIANTSAAVAGITYGQPAMMSAMMPTGALPDNFAAVLSLVSQVGHSMAKARLKMATLAMACSITLLGGAAEATRFLPESMRPNLDFLAPSQLIKNLLTPALPAMRMQDVPKPKVEVAKVDNNLLDTRAAYIAPPVQSLVAVNQPVLALQWPPPLQMPIPNSSAPVVIPTLSLATAPTPRQVAPATLAVTAAAIAPSAKTSTQTDGFHLTSASGGSTERSAPSTESTSAAPPPGPGHREPGAPLSAAVSPDAFSTISQNVPRVRPIASFEGSAVGGATFNHIPTVPNDILGRPHGPLPLPTGDAAYVPDSIILRSGQTFLNGDGRYEWADTAAGIAGGGTNSAAFTFAGLAPTPGVLTVERLPVTTLNAPIRPIGHHFVGIWSLNSTVDYDSIRVMARYDEAFAESQNLPENVLKLWVYSGGAWIRIMDDSFERDMVGHALSGKYDGEIQFFAVSAPEPTGTLGLLVVGGGALLRRRRAKAK